MRKLILSFALLSMSCGAFAAKEIRHSEMADMGTNLGSISVSVRNGTIDEAVKELSSKADSKDAKFFRITSIGMDGMGSNVTARADLYN
ncbi:DUF1471 domain-containing protein [Scandinavium goeteborgense]|uniref:DUF1471 domain-containing protein n=1 Tax=Scandinavium goeteborgense TaxID=1851514 RepID=UPI000F68B27D|nr:DUF1471 domain-containing protein [Scandinavium goeteborgense]QKN79850.1 DUF1471 domain-containing protein [Scandinavium goeteborgense]